MATPAIRGINANSPGAALLDRNDGLQKRKLPIKRSCRLCAYDTKEEAAKHRVPDGTFVKVQCVHKSVPRII
jgi:hypothetical protein